MRKAVEKATQKAYEQGVEDKTIETVLAMNKISITKENISVVIKLSIQQVEQIINAH